MAWRTDAFSSPWDNLSAYAFSPVGQINGAPTMLQRYNTDLILIAPWWPNQAWFQLLAQHLVNHPGSSRRPAQGPTTSRRPAVAPTRCVEIFKSTLQAAGFSSRAATVAADARRRFTFRTLVPHSTLDGSGATSTLTIPFRLPQLDQASDFIPSPASRASRSTAFRIAELTTSSLTDHRLVPTLSPLRSFEPCLPHFQLEASRPIVVDQRYPCNFR